MVLIVFMPLSGAVYISRSTSSGIVVATLTNSEDYTNITVQEAWEMLTSTSDGIQKPIDIRTLEEWKQGRIDTPPPEDPVHWPNLHFGEGLQEFMEEYTDKEVIIYCRSANRSWTATKLLIANGFTGTIYHMLGGINAWKDAGYPTIPKSRFLLVSHTIPIEFLEKFPNAFPILRYLLGLQF